MKAKQYDLPIDIKEGLMFSEKITLVTGDEGANIFVVRLFEDSAAPYDISGAVVRLVVKTPSGSTVQETLSIQNAAQGRAAKSLVTDCFCEIGEHIAEVQVWEGNLSVKRLTTPQFKYRVRGSLQDDGTVEAQTKFSLLQELIEGLADQNNPHNVTAAQVGASNPNLLINGDFRSGSVVNQRGLTTYISTGYSYMYTIDRWRIRGPGAQLNITKSGVVFKKYIEVGWAEISQIIDRNITEGLPLTLSAIIDGEVQGFTVDAGWKYTSENATLKALYLPSNAVSLSVRTTADNRIEVHSYIGANYAIGTQILIERIKLERGLVSTILNDAPVNYMESLSLCQKYYLRPEASAAGNYGFLGLCQSYNATGAIILLPYGFRLRSPTLRHNGNFYLTKTTYNNTGRIPVTSIDILNSTAVSNKSVALFLGTNETSLTEEYKFIAEYGSWIEFDAEIY